MIHKKRGNFSSKNTFQGMVDRRKKKEEEERRRRKKLWRSGEYELEPDFNEFQINCS